MALCTDDSRSGNLPLGYRCALVLEPSRAARGQLDLRRAQDAHDRDGSPPKPNTAFHSAYIVQTRFATTSLALWRAWLGEDITSVVEQGRSQET